MESFELSGLPEPGWMEAGLAWDLSEGLVCGADPSADGRIIVAALDPLSDRFIDSRPDIGWTLRSFAALARRGVHDYLPENEARERGYTRLGMLKTRFGDAWAPSNRRSLEYVWRLSATAREAKRAFEAAGHPIELKIERNAITVALLNCEDVVARAELALVSGPVTVDAIATALETKSCEAAEAGRAAAASAIRDAVVAAKTSCEGYDRNMMDGALVLTRGPRSGMRTLGVFREPGGYSVRTCVVDLDEDRALVEVAHELLPGGTAEAILDADSSGVVVDLSCQALDRELARQLEGSSEDLGGGLRLLPFSARSAAEAAAAVCARRGALVSRSKTLEEANEACARTARIELVPAVALEAKRRERACRAR